MAKKQLTEAMRVVIASMLQSLNEGKTDQEIIEGSLTDKIGEDDCTEELLVQLLKLAKDQKSMLDKANSKTLKSTEDGKVIGNMDKQEKHPFPKSWSDHVVIRVSEFRKIEGTKDNVEVPSSIKVQPYDPEVYDELVKGKAFKGKTVKILHDPRN
jgi:hypothetical protein